VLCIGGLDPAGRAGLLADARAVEVMGARPLCVAAALTHQSSLRVDGTTPVAPEVLRAQLLPLLRDEPIAAVKLGMIGSAVNAAVIAELAPAVPLVVDTPLVSSSGAPLLPGHEMHEAYARLLARATLVTPNGPEVFLLADRASGDRDAALEAAASLGAKAVLVKGGHFDGARVVDVLVADGERTSFESPRVEGRFRGTGCRLAAAIAARLAERDPLEEAIRTARDWLRARLFVESRGQR
jgi:hydroxymethylpyrimidine/phosphomethylpyrimidine kinase